MKRRTRPEHQETLQLRAQRDALGSVSIEVSARGRVAIGFLAAIVAVVVVIVALTKLA